MNSRHRRRKHLEESSPSFDEFGSGSEGEGYAETRSASIRRDTDARENARTLLSHSADVTGRTSRSYGSTTVDPNTGRPLARRRRSPVSRSRRESPAATYGTREVTPKTRDRIAALWPADRRYPTRHASPRRLAEVRRSDRSPGRDAVPRLDLKRSRGTSAIPGTGSGAGPSATTARTPSILSSPRRAASRTEDSQARPAQSVRFSGMKDKRTPGSKERRADTGVSSRSAVPASTESFIPADQGSSDDSSSSSSSSTSELELKRNRRRVQAGGARPTKLTSRVGIPERRQSNNPKTPRRRIPRESATTDARERQPSHSVRYSSRKRFAGDDSSSSGSESSTSSSSISSSSVERSRDGAMVPRDRVDRTAILKREQRTSAAQTDETLTSRPASISRASQTNLLRPAKRVVSRPTPSSAPGPKRTKQATFASARPVKTGWQTATRSAATSDAPKTASISASPALDASRRRHRDAGPSSSTPSIERVSSATEPPSSVVVVPAVAADGSGGVAADGSEGVEADGSEGVAADGSQGVASTVAAASPTSVDRDRFAEKVARVLERLLPRERRVAKEEPRWPTLSGDRDRREVGTETPSLTRATTTTSTTGVDDSSDTAVAPPEEDRGRSTTGAPLVDGLVEHSEPPSELQREKQADTGEATVPQWKSSSADAAPLTSGDYGTRDTELAAKTEPATTVATELEPSSSYLGVGLVIPPSMPTEDSTTKLQAPPPPTEDREVPTIEFRSHPQPDWSVTGEPRREPPAESPLPAVARTRLWQPWILCSAAGAMILLPLAFVLVPLLTSAAAGGAWRRAVSHSSHNGTEAPGQVVTVRRQDVYVEDADAPISCNGSASGQLENASALTVVAGAYSAPYRGDAEPRPQFRPVFCVFDAEFFHPRRPYTPLQIPTPLCSAVIFYSLSLSRFGAGSDGGGGFRRPLDAELFENVSASRLDGRLRHRGRRCPLYATFGGRRSDSAEFVRMLRDPAWRKATVEGIVNDTSSSERAKYDGVNLDWNRPGDECDVLGQPQLFHVLVESLGARRVRVMLTVPPLPRYVAAYDLEPVLDSVEHVVVATHKLRPRSSVDCSGARLYAAPRFREIRDAYSAAYRKKFAYSVSAGGDTFVTRSVALGAAAHAAPPPTSGLVLRPNKTSFESVCNVKPVIVNPADKECVVAILQIEKSLDASILYYTLNRRSFTGDGFEFAQTRK
ncbi:streptococcal hemagglutinin-like isoform X2 [Dermacentor albipictus]|uniref:streptococcal hemagglutinin-like isoform X2 n=1 Tax=Dermacentor albipictus TaxID=60249 RepID=UPI0031FC7B95